jgi:hypothetical protein
MVICQWSRQWPSLYTDFLSELRACDAWLRSVRMSLPLRIMEAAAAASKLTSLRDWIRRDAKGCGMQDFGGVPSGDYGFVPGGRFSADRFGGGGLGREDLGHGCTGSGGTRDSRMGGIGTRADVAGPDGAFGPEGGMGRLVMAETLGLAMARRAADILERNRDVLTRAPLDHDGPDGRQFAVDNAVFTAVLDAANECLGRFDSRPPADRWCDALLYLLDLARYAAESE